MQQEGAQRLMDLSEEKTEYRPRRGETKTSVRICGAEMRILFVGVCATMIGIKPT